jgi:hypothetical protein
MVIQIADKLSLPRRQTSRGLPRKSGKLGKNPAPSSRINLCRSRIRITIFPAFTKVAKAYLFYPFSFRKKTVSFFLEAGIGVEQQASGPSWFCMFPAP